MATILTVDDSPSIRQMIKVVLEPAGHNVIEAGDGAQGLAPDRPGHDRRYAIDASKIKRDLGWRQSESFESGLARTVDWYLQHQDWVRRVLDGSYRMERLGGVAA